MKRDQVESLVAALASHPGIEGCALAEASSGMVLFHAGALAQLESTAEAAMELWRVHSRHPLQFAAFGELQSAAFSFGNRLVALFPCSDSGLVLVCVTAKGGIDWPEWGRRVQALKAALP